MSTNYTTVLYNPPNLRSQDHRDSMSPRIEPMSDARTRTMADIAICAQRILRATRANMSTSRTQMAVSRRMGGRRAVARTAATRAGCGVPSLVAGCVAGWDWSGVRGGVKDWETRDACVCGRVGLGAMSGIARRMVIASWTG